MSRVRSSCVIFTPSSPQLTEGPGSPNLEVEGKARCEYEEECYRSDIDNYLFNIGYHCKICLQVGLLGRHRVRLQGVLQQLLLLAHQLGVVVLLRQRAERAASTAQTNDWIL